MSDNDLLALCKKCGAQAILWKRKFIGLLPEVDRRGLYLKKRCTSIYEFAAKFGGVTKKHTQRVIQIDKAFEEKGVAMLREMLQEGMVSISKLIKVVSIASVENEPDLVFAVKKLSHESLETYVRDMRCTETKRTPERERRCFGEHDENGRFLMEWLYDEKGGSQSSELQIENGFSKPFNYPKSVRANTFADGVVEMQHQAVALKKLRLNLSKETAEHEQKRCEENKEPSRRISVKIKRILEEEFGTKCAVGGCSKDATQIHHTVPFSINGSNSPDLLKPLCRAHHDIVHSMNNTYLRRKFG